MKNGAKNIKAQSIATIQKDFRKNNIVNTEEIKQNVHIENINYIIIKCVLYYDTQLVHSRNAIS